MKLGIRRTGPWLALAGASVLAISCDAATEPLPSLAEVVSVVVSPNSHTFEALGSRTKLSVAVYDTRGNVIRGQTVTWTVSDPEVAAVDSEGAITALGTGTTTVMARAAGKSSAAVVRVNPRAVSVEVTPAVVVFSAVGVSQLLEAVGLDAKGNPVTNCKPQWSSAAESVATVTTDGTVTSRSPGQARITASCGGVSGGADVGVTQTVSAITLSPASITADVGTVTTLHAAAADPSGQPVGDASFTWTSSNASVAVVSAAGEVTGVGAGTAVISASSGTATAAVTATYKAPAVASISVSPTSYSFESVSGGVQATAVVRDANGQVLDGRKVSWSSASTAVASVDEKGYISVLGSGATTVTASAEGKSASLQVTVTQKAASLSISPASSKFEALADSRTLTATVTDASGNPVLGCTPSWASSAESVVGVNEMGIITARGLGKALITATCAGVVGGAEVEVTQVVDAVSVSPATATGDVGTSTKLFATAKDRNGYPVAATVSWATSNSAVATVDNSGAVSFVSAGTGTVTATSGGKSGQSEVTGSLPPTSNGKPLFYDGFESGDLSHTENGVSWTGSVGVVKGEHAFSGAHAQRHRYGPDPVTGQPRWSEQRFRLAPAAGAGYSEVWVEFMIRWPDNFVHEPKLPSNNKLFAIWSEHYNDPDKTGISVIFNYEKVAQNTLGSHINIHATSDGYNLNPNQHVVRHDNIVSASGHNGQWLRFRIHIRAASGPGVKDGLFRLWRDNTLVAELTDWPLYRTGGHNYFRNGYVMGWANSASSLGFAETTDFYLDDFKVFTSNPGW
jgi:uncharacterized protein YjdB